MPDLLNDGAPEMMNEQQGSQDNPTQTMGMPETKAQAQTQTAITPTNMPTQNKMTNAEEQLPQTGDVSSQKTSTLGTVLLALAGLLGLGAASDRKKKKD